MWYMRTQRSLCVTVKFHISLDFNIKILNWITMMTLLVLFNGVHYFIVLLYIDGVTTVTFEPGEIRVQNIFFIHAFDVNTENSHYKTIKLAMLYLVSSVVWSSEMQLLFMCLKQPLVTKSYWMSVCPLLWRIWFVIFTLLYISCILLKPEVVCLGATCNAHSM